jgi:outer membrane protein assembly factor BamD
MVIKLLRFVLPAVLLTAAACASGSRYRGLDADALYALAQSDLEREDYGDATDALDRLLLVFPSFQEAPTAAMLLAEAHYLDERFITAASEYTRFLERYPTHPDVPMAALGICKSYSALSPIAQRDQGYTQQALTVCRNVAVDYRGLAQSDSAAVIAVEMEEKLARKVFENGEYYLKRRFFDSAIIYFEDVVERYPGTTWAPRALLGVIEAYTAVGYEEEVEEARDQLLTRYPDSPEAIALRESMGDPGPPA